MISINRTLKGNRKEKSENVKIPYARFQRKRCQFGCKREENGEITRFKRYPRTWKEKTAQI